MKKQILLFAALIGAASYVWAEPAIRITGEIQHEFRYAGIDSEGYCRLVSSGVEGKCFRLRNPLEKKSLCFHPYIRPLKIASTSTPVMIRGSFKGKGRVYMGLLTYGRNNGLIYPAQSGIEFTLDSPDQWVTREFTFTPLAGKTYALKADKVTVRIDLRPGADVLMDNLTMEFVEKNDIEIEQ